MKKITKLLFGWFSFITLPYLLRRWFHSEEFTGHLSMLNISDDKSIGYYIIPGLVPPSDDVFAKIFKSSNYDLNLIRFGRKDYDLDLAAQEIAKHAQYTGYQKIRIITFAMGDHILVFLDHYLKSYIHKEALEIVVIDPVPHQEFISHKYRDHLKFFEILIIGRVLCGWIAELPFIRRLGFWYSPAEVIEPLCSLSGYDYDYTEDEIFESVIAVIKDRHVFYEPSNSEKLYSVTFNWTEDSEEISRPIYYTSNHGSELQNENVARQYRNIFDIINWTF